MKPDIGSQDSSARQAAADLAPQLYPELRRAARGIRAGARAGETLQTTALIHEAFLKLARGGGWKDRGHFLAAAALAMRQILVDEARGRLAQRRGAGQTPLSLDAEEVAEVAGETEPDERVIAVGEALERLAAISPRLAHVVECRYYAGYTELETAEALGLTERTVRRDWVKARAWLYREIAED
ncbi:MAG: ECF-type sigma factor [Sinimarinibacterium flocculans]|uniref:RNA polymerase ECF family sigma subunit n=1 Tax=Sinimarinibacterium flocculans TaxID=985250 RepID=A0A318E5Q7_9GAMM|nr:ECF-type sigma factor [Sinimarinibacterium flocculans]PXV66616.1 RNA polymerase ECF family sigma subunit [Sinimarinibacterium flocculans]